MIYPIVIYGAQTLRNKSQDITPDYPELKKLIDDMFLTMDEAAGVGLAAPQIGKNIRLFVVNCTPWADEDPSLADYRKVFINAQIYEHSEETDLFNEGCLSIPGIHEDVRRPIAIRMRYMDENFVEHDELFEGLPARVIQHEYDHLEGQVFTDHLSPLRRNLLKGKMVKMSKGQYRCAYKTK
ncbi:MAG: peptide deformylase [Alistipes sp.]|jgi:peptide deformylase|nr:peptide deformylase [Alistipes sp.]MBQ1957905.1 peptide deformylase [Alistipes sp.]MBQ1980770.1 peptide deformylase [Alistipes sp.]MBQ2415893.1 peptide deformylase [Alistipes sp.]MBQ5623997.1 peptide deformylase [Alistipes sp.]